MNVKNSTPKNIAALLNQLYQKLDDYYISALDKNEQLNTLYTKYKEISISYNTEVSNLNALLSSTQINVDHLTKQVITLNNEKQILILIKIKLENEISSYICPFNKINNSISLPCGKCTTCKLSPYLVENIPPVIEYCLPKPPPHPIQPIQSIIKTKIQTSQIYKFFCKIF